MYSELDAFSGYIRHNVNDIRPLVRDLKLACLFYDQVIINTPAFAEHPLTLPAFEILSPFVQSGILWTSTKNSHETPFDFVHHRMMYSYHEEKNKKIPVSINKTLERWEKITPSKWSIFRNANAQINDATSNIIKNLSLLKTPKTEYLYKQIFLEILQTMQSNNIFDRDYLLAKIASSKEELSQETVNNIAILIQSEYINQGVHNKGYKIVLFPGLFVRKTNRTDLLNKYLPIDLITLPTAIRRFQNMGYSIKPLLTIPVNELFILASSEAWVKWRKHLLSDQWSKENDIEMLSLFLSKVPLGKAVDILYENIKPASAIILPKWQLIGKSGLGVVSQRKKRYNFSLNITTRKLYLGKGDKDIFLEKSYVNLLSILISSGNIGLSTEQIKLFDIEKRVILNSNNGLHTKYRKNETLDKSTLNRLYVLKNRVNKKIHPLKIMISNSLWKLKLPDGYSISLMGSVWESEKKRSIQKEKVPKLPPKSKNIFLLLKNKSPNFVHSEIIVSSFYRNSPNAKKKVSDAIYRLQQQLKSSSYIIIKDYNGGYALIKK